MLVMHIPFQLLQIGSQQKQKKIHRLPSLPFSRVFVNAIYCVVVPRKRNWSMAFRSPKFRYGLRSEIARPPLTSVAEVLRWPLSSETSKTPKYTKNGDERAASRLNG